MVGHFHHQASCDCGTSVCVESYYEQVPMLICPSCKKPVKTNLTYEPGAFVEETENICANCMATFNVLPEEAKMVACPVCGKLATEGAPNVEKILPQVQ